MRARWDGNRWSGVAEARYEVEVGRRTPRRKRARGRSARGRRGVIGGATGSGCGGDSIHSSMVVDHRREVGLVTMRSGSTHQRRGARAVRGAHAIIRPGLTNAKLGVAGAVAPWRCLAAPTVRAPVRRSEDQCRGVHRRRGVSMPEQRALAACPDRPGREGRSGRALVMMPGGWLPGKWTGRRRRGMSTGARADTGLQRRPTRTGCVAVRQEVSGAGREALSWHAVESYPYAGTACRRARGG